MSIVLATLSTKSSLSLAFCSASGVKQVIQIAQCYCNAPRPCTSVTKKTVVAGKNTPELYVSHSRLVFFINLHFFRFILKIEFSNLPAFFYRNGVFFLTFDESGIPTSLQISFP